MGAEGGGGGCSSWMDPPEAYGVSPFQHGSVVKGLVPFENASAFWSGKHVNSFARKVHLGSECPDWLHNRLGIYEENPTISYNISGTSDLAPSVLPKGIPYSQLGDSITVMESSSKFNSKFSHSGYMTQLGSCSKNPTVHYPATCSTSPQVYSPSARIISSSMDYNMPGNGYSMGQHVESYRADGEHEGNLHTHPKELKFNKIIEVKEGYDDRARPNTKEKHICVPMDSSSTKIGLPLVNELATVNSVDSCADVKSGMKLEHLKIPSVFATECASAEHKNSIESSSQTLDQLNLAVDSPCWKGAPISRQSPFSVDESIGLQPAVEESKECNNLDQGQKNPSLHVGCWIWEVNKKASAVVSPKESSSVTLTSIQPKFSDAPKAEPDMIEDKGNTVNCSDGCKEQSNEKIIDQKGHSEVNDNNTSQLGKKEKPFSANHPISANQTANLEADHKYAVPGKPSFLGNDVRLLVKTLHSLSEVLVSSYGSVTNELKEHDHVLLELAIDNLVAFTVKNKKAAQPQDAGFKAGDSVTNHTNMDINDMKVKIHSTRSSMNSDGLDNCVYRGGVDDSTRVNDMTQAFEKVLERTSFEQEENHQALIYKNLWLESEVAVCSVKYELQLAHMKINNLKQQQAKGKSAMTGSSSLNAVRDLEGFNRSPLKASTSHEPFSNLKKIEEIDASVMARLSILKARTDKSDLTGTEQQMHLSLGNAGARSGAEEIVCSPVRAEVGSGNSAVAEHFPTQLADLGFIEGNSLLSDKGHHPLEKGKAEVDKEIRRSVSQISDEAATGGGFHRYGPSEWQGKRFLGGGHASPTASTSEWEHVMMDDLYMY